MKKMNFCPTHSKELMRHYCITCKHLICIECIVDHSGHEFVRKEESSKNSYHFIIHLAYILKEQAESVVTSLENISKRTESLLKEGY